MQRFFKKLTALFLVAAMVLSGAVAVAANVQDNPVFLPLRMIFESRGADVAWIAESRQIVVNHGDDEFVFTMGSELAEINGEEWVLSHPIYGGRRAYISFADAEFIFRHESEQFAETINTAVLTAFNLMESLSITGITMAIVDAETGFTWTSGFGYADTQNSVFVNDSHVFSLASISKTFTALAVMQLVYEGLIDLDAPLVTYLPEFSLNPSPVFEGYYGDITVRMLLSQTSGVFPDFWGHGHITSGAYNPDYLNNLLELLAGEYIISPPGSTFTYANHNFNLLGILVARMAGYTDYFYGYNSYILNNIFGPIGMDSSTFIVDDATRSRLAGSYVNAHTPAEFVQLNSLPTGGLHSNAVDMARFMHMMLDGGSIDGISVLSPNYIDQMLTQHDFDFSLGIMGMAYGLGTMHRLEMNGFSHVGHGGNAVHFHSEMLFDLDSQIGVFVSSNSATGMLGMPSLAAAVLQTAVMEKTGVLDLAAPLTDPQAIPIEMSYEELQQFTGLYVIPQSLIMILHDDDLGLFIPGVGPITPLSDGSFDLLGDRGWFETREILGEETVILFLGPFARHTFGTRIAGTEPGILDESILPWVGTYRAMDADNHVTIAYELTIIADESTGMALMLFSTLHGLNPIAPIARLDDRWFFGGSVMEFSMDGDTAVLELSGSRFERVE